MDQSFDRLRTSAQMLDHDPAGAAAFLTEHGMPISRHTLAAYRHYGGGPPFWRIGPRRVRYQEADLLAWAQGRLKREAKLAPERWSKVDPWG